MYSYNDEPSILELYASDCWQPIKLQCEYCEARFVCKRYLEEIKRLLRLYYS